MKDDDGGIYYVIRTPGASAISLADAGENEEAYSVLTVKKSSDPVKFLPRILLSKKVKEQLRTQDEAVITEKMLPGESITVTRELYDIYSKGLHKKAALTSGIVTEDEYNANYHMLIDKYKEFCRKYYDYATHFTFRFAEDYDGLMSFFQYVASRTVDMGWKRVSKSFIDRADASGSLMVFAFRHQDWNREKNIDSYLQLLRYMLSNENFERHDIALNGSPSITFRKKVIDSSQVTHPAGSLVVNHRLKDGTVMTKSVHNEIYRYVTGKLEAGRLSDEAARIVRSKLYNAHKTETDIIKNRRYTEDRFFIQMTYTRTTESEKARINDDVREKMEQGAPNRLVIVRGITTMLYWQLRDGENRLMKEGSFDTVNGIDYKDLLSEYTKEKQTAKTERWEYGISCDKIRHDFLCSAAAEAARIAVENNALIVIEAVSDSFKDKVSFIDDSAFSKFDTILTNKLADYFNKNDASYEPASLSTPLQLASLKVKNGMQNGILFRLSNILTRSMCPYTGFADIFADQPRTVSAKRAFLSRFTEIYPLRDEDGMEGYVFRLDLKNFSLRYPIAKDTPSEFSVYASGPVSAVNRAKGYYEAKDIAAEAVEAVSSEGIKGNLLDAIREGKAAGRVVNAICDLFFATIRRREVRKCKGIEKTYAVSPALSRSEQDMTKTRIQLNAELLADKFNFLLTYEGKNLINDWLNDYIRRHQQ